MIPHDDALRARPGWPDLIGVTVHPVGEDQPVTTDLLRTALRPVLEDLEASQPGLIESVSHGDDIWLRDPSGHRVGIPAQWRGFPDQLPLLVAEAAQEAAIEALWSKGQPAIWPICPDHPDTHPLTPRSTTAGLMWTCPRSGRAVSALGQISRRH